MNRLLTLLTAVSAGLALSAAAAGAMPVSLDPGSHIGAGSIMDVQLGNGGPVGGGPNGSNNGTGSGAGGGAFRGGVSGGAAIRSGAGAAGGLRPNGGNQQPNGSKPAPMRPNGVRKVQ